MWKKIFGIAGCMGLLLILAYQISLSYAMVERPGHIEESNQSSVPADNTPEVVTNETKIVVESYDASGALTEREELPVDASLIGNNRLDMLVYANNYRETAPQEETDAGLERMVLESYSPEVVTLVKYYGTPKEKTGYYIGIRDDVVIVYLEDRSEVYEYTNIEAWMLPKELRNQLIDGIYVKDEQELFDFLQTYSS